ncbi:hypothetical protein PG985_008855 [Apiospora marii]|uniref:uncharacterized protein n=1 Tax=Apiospora marii TaxID=335849 RepID=UPI00312E6AAF
MAAQDAKTNQVGPTPAATTANCTCAAVCYLDNCCSELEQSSTPQERPEIEVVHDRNYSIQRYLSPQASLHDGNLRPALAFRTQTTEPQSRERMAAVLVALVEKLPVYQADSQHVD